MTDVIAGRQPVLEALKSDQPIEKVLVQHGAQGAAVNNIYKLAKQRGVPVVQASKERFLELAGDGVTQGVLALVGAKKYVELEDLLEISKKRNEPPFILILDEIEDPHNLGALIRTAEGAGIHGVVVPKHHSATVNQTVAKTSAGAISHIALARVSNIVQCIDELKRQGIWVVGTDSTAEKYYYQVDFTGPVAIVVGNEGKGIRRLVMEKCDFLATVPMYGKVESLNASVSGGIILFEAARQRRISGNPKPS